MAVEEFAVSFPPDLLARIRAEADAHGESLSGWLADAASRKLRHVAAMAALQAFEGEHGEITKPWERLRGSGELLAGPGESVLGEPELEAFR